MAEQEPGKCGLRQRRTSGLSLNADSGSQVDGGDVTPSASKKKFENLREFKSVQQSFDLTLLVDECDEEEIAIDTDDEGPEEPMARRPVTPTPLQDFGVSVQHSEVPMTATEFLKVNPIEQDCFTDVSDAETDDEEE